MTMDGMPNAHTNTQTISFTQSDARRKKKEEKEERISNRHETTKTRTQSYETNERKRNLIHFESVVVGRLLEAVEAVEAGEFCATDVSRLALFFCRHRIISNLFHHFTIYLEYYDEPTRIHITHTHTHMSRPPKHQLYTLSFCLIGMDMNRYQKWKLNKYFPSSYIHIWIWIWGMSGGGVLAAIRIPSEFCACTILPPICLLHDTLSFDLNIVVWLDKWREEKREYRKKYAFSQTHTHITTHT